jgi:hypothetical protein
MYIIQMCILHEQKKYIYIIKINKYNKYKYWILLNNENNYNLLYWQSVDKETHNKYSRYTVK